MLSNPIVAAVIGALAGGLMSFLVNFLYPRIKRCRLTKELSFNPENKMMARIRGSITNNGDFTLRDVTVYLTVHFDKKDVMMPPNNWEAFIHPGIEDPKVENEKICWAEAGNPQRIEIFSGATERIDLVEIPKNQKWIQLPSEKGWAVDGETSRAFLKKQKYEAKITITSRDTTGKEFPILIDPDDGVRPIKKR